MKVLIVEDNPRDLKLIGDLLTMSGHVVCAKTSSEGVLEFAVAERPDVIVLDVRLPDTDGLTLTRQLKAHADSTGIPIVAITAYPDRYSRLELMAAGCDTCIIKPFDTRVLPQQIEEIALGRKAP